MGNLKYLFGLHSKIVTSTGAKGRIVKRCNYIHLFDPYIFYIISFDSGFMDLRRESELASDE